LILLLIGAKDRKREGFFVYFPDGHRDDVHGGDIPRENTPAGQSIERESGDY
jgi:hypothetical protein